MEEQNVMFHLLLLNLTLTKDIVINKNRSQESGVVLFLSLILLISMTLISAATFFNSISETKISGNMVTVSEQWAADDIARLFAVKWLNDCQFVPKICNSTATCQACSNCVWQQGTAPRPSAQNSSWWSANGNTVNPSAGIACAANPPQYVIEEYNCDVTSQTRTYRITTFVLGTNGQSIAREYFVSPVLQIPPALMFNRSCVTSNSVSGGGSASISPNVTNTFQPTFTGYITDVWIGNGCWNTSGSFTIQINGPSGQYGPDTRNLPPANSGCGGTSGGTSGAPGSNMSSYHLNTPFKVTKNDSISVKISSSCSFHYFNPYNAGNTNIRMSIYGTAQNICATLPQLPDPAAPCPCPKAPRCNCPTSGPATCP